MVDKTPAELDPGTPSDTSIVHASENGVSTNSKGHDERNISRLQGTAPTYSSSKTYNLNDLVTESGIVYINTTAIVIPETFTPSKWVAISEENITIDVRNISGSLIPKGSAVYITGASGNNVTIDLALASGILTVPAIGIVLDDIANNSNGQVVNVGTITTLDTSSFSVGDTLFVSATSAGDLTATAPTHPNLRQTMAVVLVSNAAIGEIQVITGDISGAESGTIFNTFAIGDGLAGTKALSFVNAAGTFTAESTPTISRTQSFQDADGTIALTSDVIDTTASNVGTGVNVFLQKLGIDLEFRTLLANAEILITQNALDLAFSIGAIAQSKITGLVTALGTKIDTIVNVGTGAGLIFRDKVGTTLNLKTLLAGTGISITNNADDITIASTGAASPSIVLQNVNTETGSGGDDFFAFSGADPDSATELNTENCFPVAVKIQNITIQVSSQTDAISTCITRKNAADGNGSISIPASTTGIFRDTVNSDDFGTADFGNYQVNANGSGTLTVVSLACEVVNQ